MLLAWGLQQQGLAFRQGLEKELAPKDEWILALEQELEAANKLAEENASARKATKEQMEKMRNDFVDYQKKKWINITRLLSVPKGRRMYTRIFLRVLAKRPRRPAMLPSLTSWSGWQMS